MISSGGKNTWWLLLPLSLVLLLSYWLSLPAEPESDRSEVSNQQQADALMDNFSAMRMDERGRPQHILSAKQMAVYGDDQRMELSEPRLALIPPVGEAPIHMVALRGLIAEDGGQVFLYQGIEVLREASEDRGELRIHTDYLHFLVREQRVQTDRPVTISETNHTMQANGLQLDNQSRTLKLMSGVRSTHVVVQP